MQTYPFGLFKVKLDKQLQIMIKNKIGEVVDFIDAFSKSPSFLKYYDRATIKADQTCGARILTSSHLWTDKGNLQRQID
jgi:hypothetical protein